jgi:hypothetical protein
MDNTLMACKRIMDSSSTSTSFMLYMLFAHGFKGFHVGHGGMKSHTRMRLSASPIEWKAAMTPQNLPIKEI